MANVNYFDYFGTTVINNEEIVDIFQKFIVQKSLQNNQNLFQPYTVKEFDTLELLAKKWYGDKKYYWVVLLSNNMYDPFYDFPMSDNEIRKWATKLSTLDDNTSSYDDIYEELYTENESKKEIKYLKFEFLNQLLTELGEFV